MTYPNIETRADYERFKRDFAAGTDGLEHISSGAAPGCKECGLAEDCSEHDRELANEPWFSWSACEFCQRHLGGMREAAHAVLDGRMVHYSICDDCVYFLEYGRLDDSTMDSIGPIDVYSLDEFTRAFLACALWSSTDESTPAGGEPMDSNYDITDFEPSSLESLVEDCAQFQKDNAELLEKAYSNPKYDTGMAGHDFWLTRCGHGAGFWDRGLGAIGDKLTDAAHVWENVDLYVGDIGAAAGKICI